MAPLAAACALAALGAPRPAAAGGFTITVIGGQRTAMLTNIARPADLTALFHNPAGLGDQPGVRLHLSTSVSFLDTGFRLKRLDPDRFPAVDPAGCGTTPRAPPCRWPVGPDGYYRDTIRPEATFGVLPYLGASADLGRLGGRWRDVVVSVAVYAPDFYGAVLPEEAPTAYHIIAGAFAVGALTAGAGWRVNRYVSVGAALSYHLMRISLSQKISVADTLTPPGRKPSGLAILGQQLLGDLRLDYTGWGHGLGWIAGLLVRPTPWLTLGASYSGGTPARFRGDAEFRALGPAGETPGGLERALAAVDQQLPRELEIEMPLPHALMLGLNVAVTPWLEVGLDARLWFYNQFRRQVVRPIYDPASKAKRPLTEEGLSRDKDYGLSWEITGGVLVRPWPGRPDFQVMAGVGWDHSPIPDETFTLDNPSLSTLELGTGAAITLGGHWRLTVSYMLFLYEARDITTSRTRPPTNARGDGVAHMPGVEVSYRF